MTIHASEKLDKFSEGYLPRKMDSFPLEITREVNGQMGSESEKMADATLPFIA
jgi:hypothetical protein